MPLSTRPARIHDACLSLGGRQKSRGRQGDEQHLRKKKSPRWLCPDKQYVYGIYYLLFDSLPHPHLVLLHATTRVDGHNESALYAARAIKNSPDYVTAAK